MKDELEKFIGANKGAFDDREPGPEVWTRIEKTIPAAKERSLWNSVMIWRAAAALFFGVSLLLFVAREKRTMSSFETAQVQGDFSDMESFYRNEIAVKVALIHHYDATGESDQITQSFKKLDAMYTVLKDEMKNHPDRKVKDAMILNLLVRIDLLNQQLQKLEDVKKLEEEKKSEV